MTDYKSMFEQAVRTLAAIDEALGIGDDGCGDPDQTLTAIAELKALQKMEAPQLRKIHPLDFPIEVFLADLTTRPANIIRAEVGWFASLLAGEIRADIKKSKRAGLLHDLGKALDHQFDGSHAVIGADFIEARGEDPEVVHAVRAHHYDVQPEADMDFLVIAADAISGE